jgi:hypothetical protein
MIAFLFAEIMGTKDYRKPEWVEHMEEMQEALAGKLFSASEVHR